MYMDIYIYGYIWMYVYMYICFCMNVCMYVCMHVCECVCVCMCTCMAREYSYVTRLTAYVVWYIGHQSLNIGPHFPSLLQYLPHRYYPGAPNG